MRHFAILALVLLTAACAGGGRTTAVLSPSQCDADWGEVGLADGLDGERIGKLESYKLACARGGSALSEREEIAWRVGWRDGVEALCRLDPEGLDEARLAARDDLCGIDVAAAFADSEAEADPTPRERRGGYYGPRVYPTFGLGVGIGSRGVTFGSGLGLVFGYPYYYY